MNASIANAVLERANGCCEACGSSEHIELDHAHGRARAAESVATIWALCRRCHKRKTDSEPTRAAWLSRFLEHLEVYGYDTTKTSLDLAWERAKASLPFGRKGAAA